MRPLGPATCCIALALWAAPAGASVPFTPCPGTPDYECAALDVALDPGGPGTATTRLAVRRLVDSRAASDVLVALGGGPGQSATRFLEDFADVLAEALENRQLVVLDQRGTGDSGALRCSALEGPAALDVAVLTERVARCGAELGDTRRLYTTTQVVEDIEALRRELGVAKISLFGVSYGAYVAQRYARRYPGSIDRLVLDSPVAQEQGGAFDLSSYAAVAKMLRNMCADGACEGVTRDPVADVRKLALRLRARPLRGTVFDVRGRARAVTLRGEAELFDLFVSSDFSAPLRAALPAAVRGALLGDPAALLRLVAVDTGIADAHAFDEDNENATEFSNALYFATTCEEKPRGDAATLTPSVFAPFGPGAARSTLVGTAFCRDWPQTAVASPPAPGTIAAPALILSGARDIRTPPAEAVAVARWIPDGSLVRVPDAGHSLVSSRFACVSEALTRFFAGGAVGNPCAEGAQPGTLPAIAPPAPARVGRPAVAIGATLADAVRTLAARGPLDGPLGIGGLRGGSACAHPGPPDANQRRAAEIRLRRFAYVPGLAVSGTATVSAGRVRALAVRTPRGDLRLRGQRLTGRFDGRRIDTRADLRVDRMTVAATLVSSSRRC